MHLYFPVICVFWLRTMVPRYLFIITLNETWSLYLSYNGEGTGHILRYSPIIYIRRNVRDPVVIIVPSVGHVRRHV